MQDVHTHAARIAVAALFVGAAIEARADAITDWNTKAGDFITEAKLGTPPAIRVMAIVQTAVLAAVNAAHGASIDAAVAAANRAAMSKLMPAAQASIDAAYTAALAQIPDGPARTAGIAAGEKAAAAALALRADDATLPAESYRPHTTAGVYVPTATPAVSQWVNRKPWLMASSAQFRPAAPPALPSVSWARDYNEVKALGAKNSTRRTQEQTEIARFWEYSLPSIYFGAVRSVANAPGREPMANARLFAAVAQAMDDALIAVFDAKYHYQFWRPATAIRNGDVDGNEGTERDATWTPLVDAPMHPEYPSGHAVLAGAVGAVLQAEVGKGPMPVLATSSPTAKGATRRWTRIDDFVQEVSASRIYAGIHFRTATEAGSEMGRQIGELAVTRFLQIPY